MPRFIHSILCVAMLSLATSVIAAAPAGAQAGIKVATMGQPPYGIDVKRPVFGGACAACPWGIMGMVVKQALKHYGYEVQTCWTCATSRGPRFMADKTKPDMPANFDPLRPDSAPNPDAILDISATNEINLRDAWNGTGPYAKDNKKRQNYRIIAAVQQPNYLFAAVRKDTGIKSLSEIKDHKKPLWVYIDITDATKMVLKHYGITEEALKANRGGFLPSGSNRERRAAAEVIIHNGMLLNTPEQKVWYEASQLSDLVFLDFDPKLVEEMAKLPGYERILAPAFGLRGLDHQIDTVARKQHYIYVRDDAPDDFAYLLAKALDEHQHLWRYQAEPFYYDTKLVALTNLIPLHPGAAKYYREVGYIK